MMYARYPLSLRQVEDLLVERGIDVCHETVRFWWNRFGPLFAGATGRTGGGTLMRCLSASTARHIIYGARLITKAKCSRSWPRNGGIAGLRLSF